MSNSVKVADQNYVARYENGGDPYAAFANEGGPGIVGKLLQCKKGEWCIGADNDAVKPGTQYLALVPTSMRGWLRWADGVVADARVGLIAENYLVPHRYTLGDVGEDAWEKGPDGTPRDPWSKVYRLLMVEVARPHGDVTFSGSSFGAQLALKELCRVYATDRHLYPDAYPVVALATSIRCQRPPASSWAVVRGAGPRSPDVRAGRKKLTKAAKISGEAVREAIGDELPDWS